MVQEYIEELDKELEVLSVEIKQKEDLIYQTKTELQKALQKKAENVNKKALLLNIERQGLWGRIVGSYLQHRGHRICGYADYYILLNEKSYTHGRLDTNNGNYVWIENEYELNADIMYKFFVEDFVITDLEKWKETVIAYEKGEKVEYKDINGQGLLKFKYE